MKLHYNFILKHILSHVHYIACFLLTLYCCPKVQIKIMFWHFGAPLQAAPGAAAPFAPPPRYATESVSYTHLDVYKRQPVSGAVLMILNARI